MIKPPLKSQYLGITYPDDDCDPWYDQYVQGVNDFEAVIFYRKMFENAVLGGGGTLTWNAGSGLLSWTADFTLLVPHWGFKVAVPFGPDGTRSASLSDGQMLFLRLPMGMSGNLTMNFLSGSQLDKDRHDEIVCVARVGSSLRVRGLGEVL